MCYYSHGFKPVAIGKLVKNNGFSHLDLHTKPFLF
jgi:hypothetical protein